MCAFFKTRVIDYICEIIRASVWSVCCLDAEALLLHPTASHGGDFFLCPRCSFLCSC